MAGLEENIKKYKREDLLNFYKKYYTPNNTVIAMVSSYSHEEALNEIKKYFSKWEERNITVKEIVKEKNIEKTFTTIKSNIEQNTIIYLYTFDNLKKELELPLKILNHRLGESSNSLLFREVREKRGLAYDIYTSLNMTNNVKTLYIYTAVSENDVKAAMKAINKTILDVKEGNLEIGERDLTL